MPFFVLRGALLTLAAVLKTAIHFVSSATSALNVCMLFILGWGAVQSCILLYSARVGVESWVAGGGLNAYLQHSLVYSLCSFLLRLLFGSLLPQFVRADPSLIPLTNTSYTGSPEAPGGPGPASWGISCILVQGLVGVAWMNPRIRALAMPVLAAIPGFVH